MISADLIARYFSINHRVLHMQIEGLSHEDSLLQPPFKGNSLNWVLGHIIAGRSTALVLLGEEPVWDKEKSAPYSRDSEPINAEAAYPLEQLVDDLDKSQERLETALDRITAEELAIKRMTAPWASGCPSPTGTKPITQVRRSYCDSWPARTTRLSNSSQGVIL